MRLKHGVRMRGIRTELVAAMLAADAACRDADIDCVVTSVTDGVHSRGSRHYAGAAFDLRIRELPPGGAGRLRADLADRLGGDFDVLLEDSHIHVEYDPKEPG